MVFCADPAETRKEQPPWLRLLYLDFLQQAGIARNPITPSGPDLQCFRVPLQGGGKAFVLYNGGDKPTSATLTLAEGAPGDGVSVGLAAQGSGLVVVDGQGRLTVVETQGVVTRRGRTVLTTTGHVIVQTLDGRDLTAAAQLLILPFPGHGSTPPVGEQRASVTLAGLAGMRCELGELQARQWTRLEALPADKAGRLGYDAEQALQMILAARPSEFATASKTVERFARDPAGAP